MALVLLIGGARSGKTELAVRMASEQRSPVTVVATGEAGDAEMAERIERHRRERPESWNTIEEPLRLSEAIEQVPDDHCLIIDCLTLWVANVLARTGDAEALEQGRKAALTAAARGGPTIAVTNEVGLGIVPDNPVGRSYRDLLGRVNAAWAERAEHAYLLIAGRTLELT
jgi:adenosyl cobinamide kinase/adenosyl cobinamide phosphate guanylyltransferase